MSNKDFIQQYRNKGGWADIGTVEEGKIVEMFELNGTLIIIKERAIYSLVFPDTIDPRIKRPDLPSSIQRHVAPYGFESEIVSRTFLMTKKLFDNITADLNKDQILLQIIESLHEFGTLQDCINEYLKIEENELQKYKDHLKNNASYTIPSIPDISTRCKTVFQKVDQLMQILMHIISYSFPDAKFTHLTHFDTFLDFLIDKYGETDIFVETLKEAMPFISIMRGLRDGADHRLSRFIVKDFELSEVVGISVPSIELKKEKKKPKLDQVSINNIFPRIVGEITDIYEMVLVLICIKKLNESNNKLMKILPMPKDRRVNKHINYAIWLPIGEGGFYMQ